MKPFVLLPVLFTVLSLNPAANAQCQYSTDACVTSFSISPSAILGDQSHEAIATAHVHIPPNANGTLIAVELQIPSSLYTGPIECLSGTSLIAGEPGYLMACGSYGLSGDVTIQIAITGHNYSPPSIQTGTVYAEVYGYPEPRPSASLEFDPVSTFTQTPAQDPDTRCPPGNCGSAGAPINVMNGNTWITQTDYSIPGLGGGMEITRTWNSLWSLKQPPETLGIFGDSWRSNLEERAQQLSGGVVKYWKGDGSLLFYSWNGSSYVMTAPANDATTLIYNSITLQTTVTLKDGTQKIFNNGGYLTSVIDRNGNTTTINVDAANQNRIASVTDPAGQVVNFHYTNAQYPRLCTSLTDSVGTIASYVYDTSGRLTQVAYPDGSQLNFAYTDPNGSTLISSVTDLQGKIIESHTYDSQRRGKTSQNANGVNLVTMNYNVGVYPNENFVADSIGDSSQVVIGNQNQRLYLISTSAPGCASCGFKNASSYTLSSSGYVNSISDGNGNPTVYTYDSQGNVLMRSLPRGSSLGGRGAGTDSWTYTYNSFSEVLTATDPLNHTTTYQYDTHGNLTSVTTPSPDGIIAPSVTTFTPNAQGQITQIKDPLNNQTTIAYCPTGNNTCPYGMVSSVTDAQNNQTTYAYDARGNRTSVTDAKSNTTQFQYDSVNRLTLITYPTSPATTVQFHYDWRGRRDYVIDQNGNKTTNGYDDADRLLTVTDAQTPTSGVTTYAYDTENNLTDIWDAKNNHTQFAYWGGTGHQLRSTTFPSGYTETYQWDGNDNLTRKTDRNSNQIVYWFDYQNRMIQKMYPDGSQVTYTIDAAGRLTQTNDSDGVYTFGYDNMNRLTSTGTHYWFGTAGNYLIQYGYDAASNRTSMKDPQNLSTSYGYDTLNRLNSLAFNGQNPAFGFGYDTLSRRTSLTRPNGVNTSYAYDSVSRLLSVIHKLGSTTIDGASYTYDNAGNRNSKTDLRTNVTSNYGYDTIYQLLQATQGASTTESYTYDLVGNRLSSLGVSPYSYNTSNELTSTPTVTYTYDNNGSTKTKSDGTQYTWDYENRLTKVVLPGSGGTVNFKYDPFGRRVQKSFTQGSSTTTTNYLYDETDLLEEVDNSGSVLARYTPGPRIDQPLAELRTGVSSYYQQNALGSTTSLSNSVGVLANTYTYDSFGKLTASTGTITNPAQYTGREFDSETGAYFYRARHYDQNVGRFLSEDPIEFRGGINFYAYVNNRPTKYRDPRGLFRDCDEEHIECNRRCQKAPASCLPWPVGRYGSPAVRRWSRTAYCTAKCLEEYMACNAANEARQLTEYCSSNPIGCAALVTAGAVIVAQPELGPVLAPVIF